MCQLRPAKSKTGQCHFAYPLQRAADGTVLSFAETKRLGLADYKPVHPSEYNLTDEEEAAAMAQVCIPWYPSSVFSSLLCSFACPWVPSIFSSSPSLCRAPCFFSALSLQLRCAACSLFARCSCTCYFMFCARVWVQIAKQESGDATSTGDVDDTVEGSGDEVEAAAVPYELDPEPVLNSYGREALGCRLGRDSMPTLCSTYPIARELNWVDFWHDASKEVDLVRAFLPSQLLRSGHGGSRKIVWLPSLPGTCVPILHFYLVFRQSLSILDPTSGTETVPGAADAAVGAGAAGGSGVVEDEEGPNTNATHVTALRLDEQVFVTVKTDACEGFFEVRCAHNCVTPQLHTGVSRLRAYCSVCASLGCVRLQWALLLPGFGAVRALVSCLPQNGRERTSAFGNDATSVRPQTMSEFVSKNDVYNKWSEDGWFKGLMGACPVLLLLFAAWLQPVGGRQVGEGFCVHQRADPSLPCPFAGGGGLSAETVHKSNVCAQLGAMDKRLAAAFANVCPEG